LNPVSADFQLQITNHQLQIRSKFLGSNAARKKDLVIVKLGVARSETLVLSGAGVEDLVALETWLSDSEIVNFT
jgi:hypothetical protein